MSYEGETCCREAANRFEVRVCEEVKRVPAGKHVVPNVGYHKQQRDNRESDKHEPKRSAVIEFLPLTEGVEDETQSKRQEASGYQTAHCLKLATLKPDCDGQNQE